MGNPVPSQVRSVDPFSSYDSDNVNKLTRILSCGEDCILRDLAVDLTINDSTSCIASTGICIKDDVMIHLSADTIDFSDSDFYYDSTNVTAISETGYYYVALEYNYQKTSPVPYAKYVIFLPSYRLMFENNRTNYVFIKCVRVQTVGGSNQITTLYDSDPVDLATYPHAYRYLKPTATDSDVSFTTVNGSTYNMTSATTYIWATNNANLILPSLANSSGEITVIKGDSTGQITITPSPGDEINGDTTSILTTQYQVASYIPMAAQNQWINPFKSLEDVVIDARIDMQALINQARTIINSLGEWVDTTSNVTITNGARRHLDSRGGSFTVTLPASPQRGWLVWLQDYKDYCGTNTVTIGRNGNRIMGLDQDMDFDQNGDGAVLVYTDSTTGWYIL